MDPTARTARTAPTVPTVPTAAGPDGRRRAAKIDLKLGYACDHQCLFCVQGDLRRRFPEPRSAPDLIAAMRAGRAKADSIVFTGGEPTVYPYLPELVRYARLLGYSRVQIQSNGRRFSERPFAAALVEAGATEFALSLHGSTPSVHDGLTDVPGSFERTWAGITGLLGMGQRVMTNSVVTRGNAGDLPALAALLAGAGVRHIQFAFVHIVGKAAENAALIVPRKAAAVPFILRAVDAGRALGARVMTEAVPLCLLKGYEDCAAETEMPVMTIHHADGTVCEDFTRERLEVQKRKGPACGGCVHDPVCEGPWHEYPELFGWGEFVPVPAP
ncbi:MAG: radical SAM protein [Elusimicrobia bacterium]|nr:radical SAM protein [Elusimicrobiota bacterium]